jgi:cardiolipin synthase A/B
LNSNKLVIWLIGCGVGAIVALLAINLKPDERHLDRPIPQNVTSANPNFPPAMEGVIGSSIETGHAIQTLVNGDEIFPAMLDAIERAERSVNFETYIYWSGDVANRFADALSRKASGFTS